MAAADTPALTRAVQALFRAELPVELWRFAADPTAYAGWPRRYLTVCRLAVFADRPDLHGFPLWYGRACARWLNAGGSVAEPAWADEANRLLGFKAGPLAGKPWRYDAVLWRPLNGAPLRNRDAAAHRAPGSPLIGESRGPLVDRPDVPELVYFEAAA